MTARSARSFNGKELRQGGVYSSPREDKEES
jgi:hypothetical protein